jgi:hypothetical protein
MAGVTSARPTPLNPLATATCSKTMFSWKRVLGYHLRKKKKWKYVLGSIECSKHYQKIDLIARVCCWEVL